MLACTCAVFGMFIVKVCLLHADELAIAMRVDSKKNTKMMKEKIPVCYKEFQQQVIGAGMAIYREGEVFPILKYKHFE